MHQPNPLMLIYEKINIHPKHVKIVDLLDVMGNFIGNSPAVVFGLFIPHPEFYLLLDVVVRKGLLCLLIDLFGLTFYVLLKLSIGRLVVKNHLLLIEDIVHSKDISAPERDVNMLAQSSGVFSSGLDARNSLPKRVVSPPLCSDYEIMLV